MIRFKAQAYSNNRLLICTWTYNFSLITFTGYDLRYDFQLHLIKAPYIEVSKKIEIESLANDFYLRLIGLKDYFVFIKIDEDKEEGKGNITYKFVDLELNLVNSFTYEYQNYSKMIKLSNTGKVNEFMLCILKREDRSKYLDKYKCQVIKYENNNLLIKQIIDIPISGISYSLKTYFFDENKYIFYIYDIKNSYTYEYINDNYIYILQYENHVLSFYKNFKNLTLPYLVKEPSWGYYFQVDFAMTEQGVALIINRNFIYLCSICVPKTITLYANELLKFPIEEFIFPGIKPLKFSFE